MSTAPNGYQEPKTDWQASDVLTPTAFNRIEGNISAIETGDRTLDPAQTPTSSVGSLRQILSWLVNRIKAVTGGVNWYDTPVLTLVGAKQHIDDTTTAHGAVFTATANRIIVRDQNGRAQVAAPAVSADIATKGYIDDIPLTDTPGEHVIYQDPSTDMVQTETTAPTKLLEYQLTCAGYYRITFSLGTGGGTTTAYAQIYKNGSAVGALRSNNNTDQVMFTEDIDGWKVGDKLQIYAYKTGETQARIKRDSVTIGVGYAKKLL